MDLAYVLVGAVILLFGRKLFWLFVAVSGFVAGAALANDQLHGYSQGVILAIALGAGILGAILSVLLQRLAVAIGAFFAGGYLLYTFAVNLGYPQFAWIAYLVGGIVAAGFSLALFDWALIGLSALMGASMVARGLPLERSIDVAVFIGLLILGIAFQAWQMEPVVERVREPEPESRAPKS